MAKVITRTIKNGERIKETIEEIDWQPNEADLDLVTVGCECGNTFEMPWDAIAFGGLNDNDSFCGQCLKSGTMKIIDDPQGS